MDCPKVKDESNLVSNPNVPSQRLASNFNKDPFWTEAYRLAAYPNDINSLPDMKMGSEKNSSAFPFRASSCNYEKSPTSFGIQKYLQITRQV